MKGWKDVGVEGESREERRGNGNLDTLIKKEK